MSDTVDLEIDRVWNAVQLVYRELGYPGAPASNSTDRLFITPHMEIKRRLYEEQPNSAFFACDLHSGMRLDQSHINFVMMTRVRSAGDGRTLIETVIDGSARDPAATDSNRATCWGTGRLERVIAELVKQKARS